MEKDFTLTQMESETMGYGRMESGHQLRVVRFIDVK
jgi:hypothetical protein